MEFNGGHNLSKDLLNVLGKLFRIPRRNGRVGHLRIVGIALNSFQLLLLVIATEDAIRDLVDKSLEDASIVLPRIFLKSALKLLDLVLRQFVRNCLSVNAISCRPWMNDITNLLL